MPFLTEPYDVTALMRIPSEIRVQALASLAYFRDGQPTYETVAFREGMIAAARIADEQVEQYGRDNP